MSDAVIIDFPLHRVRKPIADEPTGFDPKPKKPSCMDCENVYVGSKGLYCGEFNEPVIHDDIAEDCSSFEPV